jgi:hypothetical protein
MLYLWGIIPPCFECPVKRWLSHIREYQLRESQVSEII